MDLKKEVGQRLRERREARGMTLVEVALAVGTDNGNLSRIERGEQWPNADRLAAILTALDTTLDALLNQGVGTAQALALAQELVRVLAQNQPAKKTNERTNERTNEQEAGQVASVDPLTYDPAKTPRGESKPVEVQVFQLMQSLKSPPDHVLAAKPKLLRRYTYQKIGDPTDMYTEESFQPIDEKNLKRHGYHLLSVEPQSSGHQLGSGESPTRAAPKGPRGRDHRPRDPLPETHG